MICHSGHILAAKLRHWVSTRSKYNDGIYSKNPKISNPASESPSTKESNSAAVIDFEKNRRRDGIARFIF